MDTVFPVRISRIPATTRGWMIATLNGPRRLPILKGGIAVMLHALLAVL